VLRWPKLVICGSVGTATQALIEREEARTLQFSKYQEACDNSLVPRLPKRYLGGL
jgi:hypothetical protein